MIEVQILAAPGSSAIDAPEQADAPRTGRPVLWGCLAILSVIGLGGLVEGVAMRYADDIVPNQIVKSWEVHDLCYSQLAARGYSRFTVPETLPDANGVETQSVQPWRYGDTVKVIPYGGYEIPGSDFPPLVLSCTLNPR